MENIYIVAQLIFAISFLIVAIKKFKLAHKINPENLDKTNMKDILSEDTSVLVLISISTVTLLIMSLSIYGNTSHISVYNILINSFGVWSIFEILKFNKKNVLLIISQIIILTIINVIFFLY